jgi:hypothetical protein
LRLGYGYKAGEDLACIEMIMILFVINMELELGTCHLITSSWEM